MGNSASMSGPILSPKRQSGVHLADGNRLFTATRRTRTKSGRRIPLYL